MTIAIKTVVFFVQALMVGLFMNNADEYMLLELLSDDNVVLKTTHVIISTATPFDYCLSFSVLHISDALR